MRTEFVCGGLIKKQRHYFANKGRIVKAMVFPVVIYGYESWRKLSAEELMLLNCGVGEGQEIIMRK